MSTKLKNIACLIIDDEQEACDRLESLLNKIENIDVIAKKTKAEDGIKTAIELSPDIIFLDIEMPGKSGFNIIKNIREKNFHPTFIFVTAYDQYAIKAIRSAAFDYLLKPVDIDELKSAIDRFILLKNEKHNFVFPEKVKSEYLLTDREIEIIKFILAGKSSKDIAEILFISKDTVDTHRRNIIEKTGVKSTSELIGLLRQ